MIQVRLAFEALTLVGSVIYIILALREIHHQSFRIYFQTLVCIINNMISYDGIIAMSFNNNVGSYYTLKKYKQ